MFGRNRGPTITDRIPTKRFVSPRGGDGKERRRKGDRMGEERIRGVGVVGGVKQTIRL